MADENGKVNGRWVGSYQLTYGGTELVPGITVHPVGVFELREGSNWVPADKEAERAFAKWQKLSTPEEPNTEESEPEAAPDPEPVIEETTQEGDS